MQHSKIVDDDDDDNLVAFQQQHLAGNLWESFN